MEIPEGVVTHTEGVQWSSHTGDNSSFVVIGADALTEPGMVTEHPISGSESSFVSATSCGSQSKMTLEEGTSTYN